MRALIIGSADLKYDGGGERNAVQIAEILMRMGYDVTLMGSGYPFIRKNNVNVKFNYIENAFSDDIFSNRHLMKLTNGISMGFIGLFSFNKIWEKIKDYDLYYFVTPNFIFRNAVKNLQGLISLLQLYWQIMVATLKYWITINFWKFNQIYIKHNDILRHNRQNICAGPEYLSEKLLHKSKFQGYLFNTTE
ncbi:hypothetical protein [Acidiplasma cupricumulans]|uniref:hypothetical protein n=1 Tax=Acidiplasma cupricumulans TaxID=312540 RepID=UPI000784C447|nr:hypothetical protein [Acidiplasma cupricumulans]